MGIWILGGVGLLAAGMFVLLYVIAPLVVMTQFWIKPDAPAVDVDVADLPEEVAEYLETGAAELTALGFLDLGVFRMDGMTPGSLESAFRLMLNPPIHTVAMVTWIQAYAGDQPMPMKLYVEFATETLDGRNLNTNNSRDLPSADMNTDKTVHRFADVTDLAELWWLHEALLREEAGARALRPIPLDLPPSAVLREEFVRDLQKKAARGFWRPYGSRGRYRPTVKGAYIMTWGELPPAKQWRRRRFDRAAAALRARAGM